MHACVASNWFANEHKTFPTLLTDTRPRGAFRVLEVTRQQCGHLKVGMKPDRPLPLSKGHMPVCSEAYRMEALRSLRCVNQACILMAQI